MIAFVMTAHQDPEVARRSVTHLQPHPVYLHVDAKSPEDGWETVTAAGAERIESRPVFWGAMSQLDAILRLLRTAVERSPEAGHVVLMTGACYPLRPVAQLEDFLASRPDVSFVGSMDVPRDSDVWDMANRRQFREGILPWRWIARSARCRDLDRMLRRVLREIAARLPVRRWPGPMPARYGNTHWVLSRDAALHVLAFTDSEPGRRLLRFLRRTGSPDETYVHTVMAASGLPLARPGMTYVKYGNASTANLHVIDPSLGKWYTKADLPDLLASDRFFVRKVGLPVSAGLMDALDTSIASTRDAQRPPTGA